MSSKDLLFKEYISNLKVRVHECGYVQCWDSWRDIDYTPFYNKFYFICDGEGWLKIGDKEYFPQPGQLFLMPAGIKQSYSTINENTFTKYWCHFSAKVGEMNLFDVIQLPYYVDIADKDSFKNMFDRLVTCYDSSDITASLKIKSSMLEILSYFIEHAQSRQIHLTSSPLVEKLDCVLDYIEKNLNHNFTVKELSEIVHLHPNYFIKLFRDHLGNSPIQYINNLKLEKAKQLLRIQDTSITQIADIIGYQNLYYFSKAFKTHTGYSPSEFRKLYC